MNAKEQFIKEEIQLYTVDEIAKILQAHPVTIRRYIREGKIKAQKIGKRYYVTKENLKAFVSGEEGRGNGQKF